jgi:hypothetical protein
MKRESARWLRGLAGVTLLASAVGGAQTPAKKPLETSLQFKPSILDQRKGAGTVVGAEYKASLAWNRDLSSNDAGSAVINPDARIQKLNVTASASGTVAVDKARNPKNLSEGKFDAGYLLSGSQFAVSAGAQGKFETDQSFDNTALVIGGRVTAMYCWPPATRTSCLVADGVYGRVDPSKDSVRKALLGGALGSFNRIDLEVLYKIEIKSTHIHGIEANYRLYQELSAPAGVKAAGIDTHALGTIRVDLDGDFFVAYSNGKLPFDKTDDQIVQLGWSYKLR